MMPHSCRVQGDKGGNKGYGKAESDVVTNSIHGYITTSLDAKRYIPICTCTNGGFQDYSIIWKKIIATDFTEIIIEQLEADYSVPTAEVYIKTS